MKKLAKGGKTEKGTSHESHENIWKPKRIRVERVEILFVHEKKLFTQLRFKHEFPPLDAGLNRKIEP